MTFPGCNELIHWGRVMHIAGFILFDSNNARIRAYAPRWATPRANIALRRCVVTFKYERTRVYACKLPWRLYPLVERDPRKRIWLDGISMPALKVQLGWTLRRTYARITVHCEYEGFSVCAHEVWIQLICVGNPTIIGWDNGLSPGWHQAFVWTNAGKVLISRLLRTYFNEILIAIYTFWLRKMHLKMLSGKWWPFRLGLNVLNKSAAFQNHDLAPATNQSKWLTSE